MSGGMSISSGLGLDSSTGLGPPAGFIWTTHNGERLFFNGLPVFDDGTNLYVRT